MNFLDVIFTEVEKEEAEADPDKYWEVGFDRIRTVKDPYVSLISPWYTLLVPWISQIGNYLSNGRQLAS